MAISSDWKFNNKYQFRSWCVCISADMWAMGAIMAELFTLHPLFPGARYVSEFLFQLHCFGDCTATNLMGLRLFSTCHWSNDPLWSWGGMVKSEGQIVMHCLIMC